MPFLGVAKLLGIAAILSGRSRVLKEWAYAGFTFDLLLAAYSHLLSGDGVRSVFPLLMFAVMLVSYWQWKSEDGSSNFVLFHRSFHAASARGSETHEF